MCNVIPSLEFLLVNSKDANQQFLALQRNETINPLGQEKFCLDSGKYKTLGLTVEVCNGSKFQQFVFQTKGKSTIGVLSRLGML